MKQTYFISYWDKYGTVKHTFIKAKNEQKAEKKFYKQNYNVTIIKIALN